MDIRAALAGRIYNDAQTAARPGPAPDQPVRADFAQALQDGAMETLRAMRAAEQTVIEGLSGRADAQSVVQALAATELAVETAVTVRDKVVEAYNEILRMPV